MEKNLFALLLHNQESLFASLRRALERERIKVRQAQSCAEALPLVARDDPPQVIFSSTKLPDGTWADVVNLAAKASKPARVVVVSRLADLKLYLDVLERGAFDFVAPPFSSLELAHIMQSAVRQPFKITGQVEAALSPSAAPRRGLSKPQSSRPSAA